MARFGKFPVTVAPRLFALVNFYALLDRVALAMGGARRLSECSGRRTCPLHGVYFFLEPGETRSDTGQGHRVVRVGTHALTTGSQSQLGGRLAQHRGSLKQMGGNHRGSVFRSLVGAALQERDPSSRSWSWGEKRDVWRDPQGIALTSRQIREQEKALEANVSRYLAETLVIWVAVPDTPSPASERGVIERGAIALLSNRRGAALDAPSAGWLGHHASDERIRQSGLWNRNHVDEIYDPAFLDAMEANIGAFAAAAR
jgi:hypothetical protein